ncbi:MAG: MFS transporter [Chloroflexi bacterium]|nr:MFS transporter [Chloroflexota bacterium]MCY3582621.1 MFS transporter [Chloroflexota bacterium]MCY3715862.1 MFS transporter [Chloroflexota bacterium]MDE2649857.1 MFS transporter [Chloroflexota bacterium]MXV93265.1 MFS transporter [Chloroflexota bacterium]
MIHKAYRRIVKREPIYYGWVIALALAITETVSYGVMFYAFSVFIAPMEAELGWSRAQLTGAFSLSLLITGLVGVPVGYWLDKRGGRLLMTAGSIGATILVALWSQVQTLPEFTLIMILLGFCGAAVLYEPAFAVIATWFSRRRGTAMAVLTFVAGFSSTLFIPLSDALLVAQGWRGAVLSLAVLLGAITIPLHGLLMRGKPQDLGLQPDGALETAPPAQRSEINLRAVLRSRYFWVLTLAFALSTLSISAVRIHFIPLLISVGIHPTSAAWASGSIGVMQVVGRMIFAPVERHFSSKTMVAGVFALLALSLAVLLLGNAGWIIALFVALFGMAIGTHTLARPLIVADSYGAAYYGRISSAIVIVLTLMGTSAPFAAGVIFDVFGNYDVMLLLAVGFSLASLIMIWLLPKRSAG